MLILSYSHLHAAVSSLWGQSAGNYISQNALKTMKLLKTFSLPAACSEDTSDPCKQASEELLLTFPDVQHLQQIKQQPSKTLNLSSTSCGESNRCIF